MTDMFVNKQYRRRDASRILSYIDRTERPIRDQSGREMSDEKIQRFIDKSEEYQYEESWIFSPKRGDEMSEEEISLAVRKTMREHLEDRKRASYCFSIHTDEKNNHAHVAIAGSVDDLRTDEADLDKMREIGAEHTREAERDRARSAERARETRARNEQSRQSRDRTAATERGRSR